MKPAAADVQTVVIPGAGHWVAEQAPEELVAALTACTEEATSACASVLPSEHLSRINATQ
jgi:hypothetical protein